MRPRILAIAGPQKNSVFWIGDADLRIGRDERCDVYLNDPMVSRRHCTITYIEEGDYTLLLDVHSVNGTFVNGFSYPAKNLVHGDRIRIGSSIFVYLDQDGVPALDDIESNWKPPMGPNGRFPAYEAPQNAVLDAFLRINNEINGTRNVAEIQSRVFELLYQVIPAERAAILLAGDQEHFVSVNYSRNGSDNHDPFDMDATMTAKVLRGGVATFQEQAMCCPLKALDSKVGVIYAAGASSGWGSFSSNHRKLLASIGCFTAVALEHARYVGWLECENRRLTEAITVKQRPHT